MLTELRNRGLADATVVCCDGLRGLPESIRGRRPDATVQTCVVHMVRNSLRYASRKHWGQITKAKPRSTPPEPSRPPKPPSRRSATTQKPPCPAMIRSRQNSSNEFRPLVEFPAELRRIVYTTNTVESLNARFRRAVRHRGHFPNEQAAMKILYLVATTKHKNRNNLNGKTNSLGNHPEHTHNPLQQPDRRPHQMKTITTTYTKNLTDPTSARLHLSSTGRTGPTVIRKKLWFQGEQRLPNTSWDSLCRSTRRTTVRLPM